MGSRRALLLFLFRLMCGHGRGSADDSDGSCRAGQSMSLGARVEAKSRVLVADEVGPPRTGAPARVDCKHKAATEREERAGANNERRKLEGESEREKHRHPGLAVGSVSPFEGPAFAQREHSVRANLLEQEEENCRQTKAARQAERQLTHGVTVAEHERGRKLEEPMDRSYVDK